MESLPPSHRFSRFKFFPEGGRITIEANLPQRVFEWLASNEAAFTTRLVRIRQDLASRSQAEQGNGSQRPESGAGPATRIAASKHP